MREKRLLFAAIALMLLAFVVSSTPVKADRTNVKMYVWNTGTAGPNGPGTYPWKAYTTTIMSITYVQVWIDAPEAWTDTALGVVGWTVTLQVDPTQVLVLNALQYADDAGIPDGIPDDFLGLYLGLYIGSGALLWAPPLVDAAAGTIEAGEAIAGFSELGRGSGGALTKIDGTPFALTPSGDKLIPLLRFSIKSQPGIVGPAEGIGSWLQLVEGYYNLPDGSKHPVEVLEMGCYGQPPPIPEFPFGIGILMMIAPAVAVMYLWRSRKKVTKP